MFPPDAVMTQISRASAAPVETWLEAVEVKICTELGVAESMLQ